VCKFNDVAISELRTSSQYWNFCHTSQWFRSLRTFLLERATLDPSLLFACGRCLLSVTMEVVVVFQFRQITDKNHEKISDMVFNIYK